MALRITPSRAIVEPKLLARSFQGISWDRWKACLKAAFGEPLNADERQLFEEVAGRAPPQRPVREAYFLIGRRGGKDSIASAIAVTLAMSDFRAFIRPGEMITIVLLAVSKQQARIVFNYIRASFVTNPLLAPMVVRESENSLELKNSIEIVVLANNFRSIHGRTVLCAIFDECAYWLDLETNTAYPDVETYAAIIPSMVTLPDAMLIAISTVYRKAGLIYDKFKAHYGKDDPDVLVVKAPTRAFNPLIPQSFIDQQLELDN